MPVGPEKTVRIELFGEFVEGEIDQMLLACKSDCKGYFIFGIKTLEEREELLAD